MPLQFAATRKAASRPELRVSVIASSILQLSYQLTELRDHEAEQDGTYSLTHVAPKSL